MIKELQENKKLLGTTDDECGRGRIKTSPIYDQFLGFFFPFLKNSPSS